MIISAHNMQLLENNNLPVKTYKIFQLVASCSYVVCKLQQSKSKDMYNIPLKVLKLKY